LITMRTDFQKVSDVADADAIRSMIPVAIKWLSMTVDVTMPPGSLGNGEATRRAAELVEAGAGDGLREDLIYFAVRAGSGMLSDTADCLLLAGYADAAEIAAAQARLVGSMQYPMVTGDFPAAAAALRALAPTYDQLRDALSGPHPP
jgi:hypothetical protein